MPRLALTVVLFLLAAVLTASTTNAQMPDSPTGRMAGALLELAANTDSEALDRFVAERVAESAPSTLRASLAAFLRECTGGEMGGARKTGATSAVLVLELPHGRCEVAYTIEGKAPHGLLAVATDVMMGPPKKSSLALNLPEGDDAALATALDRQLAELTAKGDFAGVVLLAREGKPFFHHAYGQANRASGLANTIDTRFDIGSITKLVTNIAIAQLAQAGQLDLAATLQSVVPDYPNAEVGVRITVEQILDHSSGLGDIFNERWAGTDKSKLLTPRDFFPLFVDLPLAFEPGTSRAYSNAGYVVLGAVIEAVSGEAYADYLARHVFAPAGMKASGFPLRDGSDPTLAIGYTRAQGGESEPNLGMLPLRGCPAGSSSHTAADLLALDNALRSGKLLDEAWTAWVYTGSHGAQGGSSNWAIAVGGGGPGVNAVLEADGTTTVVVVSNVDPPIAEQLGLELARTLRK